MEETTQLLTFLISFIYGMFFEILLEIHYHISKKYLLIFKYLTTLFLVIDIVLGYLLCIYKLNQGIFHIYFILFVFLGFIVTFPLHKYVKINKLFNKKLGKK